MAYFLYSCTCFGLAQGRDGLSLDAFGLFMSNCSILRYKQLPENSTLTRSFFPRQSVKGFDCHLFLKLKPKHLSLDILESACTVTRLSFFSKHLPNLFHMYILLMMLLVSIQLFVISMLMMKLSYRLSSVPAVILYEAGR